MKCCRKCQSLKRSLEWHKHSDVLDGAHIPLKATAVKSQDFYNYKQFCLLNVQGGCNYKYYFMDFDCRWPGSCYDAYANSNVNIKMQHKEIPINYKQIIPGEAAKIANYLIGDSDFILYKRTRILQI